MWKRFFTMLTAAFVVWGAEVDPRGIFISSTAPGAPGGAPAAPGAAPRPAVKLRIEMNQNGQSVPVSASHRFQSGDRFRFVFELSQSSHVYVVNRSIEGNPEGLRELLGTRGINVVNQAANAPAAVPKFQVLWPPAGSDAPLPARQTQTIPGGTQFFEFDANPGIEKISVLVSPYPVDITRYFTGVRSRPRANPPVAGRHDDTNADVLAQLEDLHSMDSNTTTDTGASRGICVGDCSQYSAPLHPGEPFIVTVDLVHSR